MASIVLAARPRGASAMSNQALAELRRLMIDGPLASAASLPARAAVEPGCEATADGVAEYREGSRIRVRIRALPSDRRLEVNIDGALHGTEPDGSREKAVAAVAAMFRT